MAKDNRQTQTNPEITGPAPSPVISPATPPEVAAGPAVGLPLKDYLVSLPRFKSLVSDPNDKDKKILVEKLPVKALTEGDAIQQFNKYNGITSTIHKHVVEAA
jgi:hypothetical protein